VLAYKKDKGIKRWLHTTKVDTLPAVTLNEGISTILMKRERAVSLLPVGITAISGEFEKGDLVSIKNQSGKAIGLGVARYNASLLSEVIGLKDQKIFIHYNKICIFDHPG
jgi:glutamate 5-kinase